MQIPQRATLKRPDSTPIADAACIAALLSGGDSRLVLDPVTGLNKYFCQPHPDDGVTCFSSCTASPISVSGFEQAYSCYREMTGPGGGLVCPEAFARWQGRVERYLQGASGGDSGTGVILLPSGTDAMLYASLLLSLENPGRRFTPILPSAAETGTGVPLAARCCVFDGDAAGSALRDGWDERIEVPLRGPDGVPLSDDAISAGFAAAVRMAPGHPVVTVTLGTKTGLVAPLAVPAGAEVIVDACQFRAAPSSLRGYLRRGWPVVVTGSKFLGGPPFAGAVLLPPGRFGGVTRRAMEIWQRGRMGAGPAVGPLLRWVAAMPPAGPRAARGSGSGVAAFRVAIEGALAGLPGVRIVPGASAAMIEAGGMEPSIVTFAVASGGSWLPVDRLREIHQGLAARGVLVGQPVALGGFGGLRIAIGARDLTRGTIQPGLRVLMAELADLLGGARPAMPA